MITLKKLYGMIVLSLLAVVLSGCGIFKGEEDPVVEYEVGEDVVSFANEFADLTFSSKSFDELKVFVEARGDVLSEDAKVEYFDFNDVAVMNMFRDNGSVSTYEVVETFVEDGLSGGSANVIVVSEVTYSFANLEGEVEHDEGTEDFHSHDVTYQDRTVVDIFRIKEGSIVSVERL